MLNDERLHSSFSVIDHPLTRVPGFIVPVIVHRSSLFGMHHTLPFGATAADFAWATGIEDTFVPQTRPGLRSLDEYELTGHYEHWREHLQLAKACGARMLRWGIPWYRVEPEPGVFDWSWTDQVIDCITDGLGLEPIIDLVHYGTPLWLPATFADQRYPEYVARFATAAARRYGDRVRYWTPLNEPLIHSLYAGKRGEWPPYGRGDSGFVALMLQLVRGIQATVEALHDAAPGATIVHVEAAGLTRAASEELEPLAAQRRERGFLSYDLLAGRVVPGHALWEWLLRKGADPNELAAIARCPMAFDIMGLNFYPQWSTSRLSIDRRGRRRWSMAEKDGAGFGELLRAYHTRYGAPLMVTETSSIGRKAAWLDRSVADVRAARRAGVPVLGYTWFPLFTMVDWRYRTGSRPLEEYLIELGLYESRGRHNGSLELVPTELADRFRAYTLDPASVGDLNRNDER